MHHCALCAANVPGAGSTFHVRVARLTGPERVGVRMCTRVAANEPGAQPYAQIKPKRVERPRNTTLETTPPQMGGFGVTS